MTFKVGDTVRCIDDSLCLFICKGRMYTVKRVAEKYVYICNEVFEEAPYESCRFRLETPTPSAAEALKEGTVVECIDATDRAELTEGKLYTVKKVVDSSLVTLQGNGLDINPYHLSRFWIVEDRYSALEKEHLEAQAALKKRVADLLKENEDLKRRMACARGFLNNWLSI